MKNIILPLQPLPAKGDALIELEKVSTVVKDDKNANSLLKDPKKITAHIEVLRKTNA